MTAMRMLAAPQPHARRLLALTGLDEVFRAGTSTESALADLARGRLAGLIGLRHERDTRRSDTAARQLQATLNSRIVIEQAKGKLAETDGIDVDRAFMLRDHARNTRQHLADVASAFVDSPARNSRPPARHQPLR